MEEIRIHPTKPNQVVATVENSYEHYVLVRDTLPYLSLKAYRILSDRPAGDPNYYPHDIALPQSWLGLIAYRLGQQESRYNNSVFGRAYNDVGNRILDFLDAQAVDN